MPLWEKHEELQSAHDESGDTDRQGIGLLEVILIFFVCLCGGMSICGALSGFMQ